jgi:ribosomal protein S18 acetylase RimI-like enzyme
MNTDLIYRTNRASAEEIAGHLRSCDSRFVPPLSARVDIDDYARKIVERAKRFEAWDGDRLVGVVAAYCNDAPPGCAFITNVSVDCEWTGRGVGVHLVRDCLRGVRECGLRRVHLEVGAANRAAVALYMRLGFVVDRETGGVLTMSMGC